MRTQSPGCWVRREKWAVPVSRGPVRASLQGQGKVIQRSDMIAFVFGEKPSAWKG